MRIVERYLEVSGWKLYSFDKIKRGDIVRFWDPFTDSGYSESNLNEVNFLAIDEPQRSLDGKWSVECVPVNLENIFIRADHD